jgi:hypothetical protein
MRLSGEEVIGMVFTLLVVFLIVGGVIGLVNRSAEISRGEVRARVLVPCVGFNHLSGCPVRLMALGDTESFRECIFQGDACCRSWM